MKLVKKLAMAVTAVAICCTATLPTVAHAGTTACSHHYVSQGISTITEGASWEHLYANGTKICRVDLVKYYDVLECDICGYTKSVLVDTLDKHRDCGQ